MSCIDHGQVEIGKRFGITQGYVTKLLSGRNRNCPV